VVLIAIPACKTVPIVNRPSQVENCKFLGPVDAWYFEGEGAVQRFTVYDKALDELRDKATQMGGNVILQKDIYLAGGGRTIVGDVYHCGDAQGK
jgi:hypothetical protein